MFTKKKEEEEEGAVLRILSSQALSATCPANPLASALKYWKGCADKLKFSMHLEISVCALEIKTRCQIALAVRRFYRPRRTGWDSEIMYGVHNYILK